MRGRRSRQPRPRQRDLSRRMAARAPVSPDAMANILILVGTGSGNAQMVADAPEAGARTRRPRRRRQRQGGDAPPTSRRTTCCWWSAPRTARATSRPTSCRWPRRWSASGPILSGHRYGVIALGDMTYQDTFCGGGKKVDRVFELCGAAAAGRRGWRSTPPPAAARRRGAGLDRGLEEPGHLTPLWLAIRN